MTEQEKLAYIYSVLDWYYCGSIPNEETSKRLRTLPLLDLLYEVVQSIEENG